MSYLIGKPSIPCLHKCQWCNKRLNGNMETVCEILGPDIVGWFCSKDCARKKELYRKKMQKEYRKLNEFICGE